VREGVDPVWLTKCGCMDPRVKPEDDGERAAADGEPWDDAGYESDWPICPLEGEMPGRAEGGSHGQDDHHLSSPTPANPVIFSSLAFSSPSGW